MCINFLLSAHILQEVRFVTDEYLGYHCTTMIVYLLKPKLGFFEGVGCCHIKYDACCFRQLKVVEDDGAVALLSS
jgi:hypothetical protein